MLKDSKAIKTIHENIQRKLYYMIPEKWDELDLYASVIDRPNGLVSGELFFYYIPKGILRKKPISVYEVPNRFNIDENEYLKLVDILYSDIKLLREEYKKIEGGSTWSNLTMSIKNTKYRVEYDYEDLLKSDYNSYEKHILWRYNILGISLEQCTREERDVIKSYETGVKILSRKEVYEEGIYIKNVKNIVDYATQDYKDTKDIDEIAEEDVIQKNKKNQILMGFEEPEEDEEKKKKFNKYNIK